MRFFACLLALTLALPPSRFRRRSPRVPRMPKETGPASPGSPARVHPRRALRTLGQSPERAGGRRHRLPDRAPLGPFRVGYGRSPPEPGRRGRRKKNFPLAVELLDRVLTLQPSWAEAWYTAGDRLLPARRSGCRHGRPATGPSSSSRGISLPGRASAISSWHPTTRRAPCEAFRRALKINPQMSDVQDHRRAPQPRG